MIGLLTCAGSLRRCVFRYFFKTTYNETIIRFGFYDILNYPGLSKCYPFRPSARPLITLTSTLIIHHKNLCVSDKWRIETINIVNFKDIYCKAPQIFWNISAENNLAVIGRLHRPSNEEWFRRVYISEENLLLLPSISFQILSKGTWNELFCFNRTLFSFYVLFL